MQAKAHSLNRLVSLTFDENPEIRKLAAKELGDIDDPAALFALVELSYDKDVGVKTAAQDILEGKKAKNQEEVMSFAEIFSPKNQKPTEEKMQEKIQLTAREKVLQPITRIFEKKLGKEKAERLKSKMMPAIEKMYLKSVGTPQAVENDSEKKAVQEFLTSYLEAVSDLGQVTAVATAPSVASAGEFGVHEELAEELETIGTKEKELDNVSKEIAEIEAADLQEQKEENVLEKLPDTVFKKAYETMMISGGDEEVMRNEMHRLTRNFEKEVKLAYTLAKKKFKELKITHLAKLRDNMRNVNTEDLLVKEVEHGEYSKTKKIKASYTRVLVNDEEGNEGIIYLFDGRGSAIKTNMKVRVVRGQVKTFDFSHETALTIGIKGNVYIVL